MNHEEAVYLTRYVAACCPQQAIDEYTPDAWHDLLGDLDLAGCKEAAAAIGKRQPFVAPAEIRAEVRRLREDRLRRTLLPAPSPELADEPGRYRQALAAGIRRIADGMSVRKAIGPGPLAGEPPAAWREVREAMAVPESAPADPQQAALEQAEASRADRAAREAAAREAAERGAAS